MAGRAAAVVYTCAVAPDDLHCTPLSVLRTGVSTAPLSATQFTMRPPGGPEPCPSAHSFTPAGSCRAMELASVSATARKFRSRAGPRCSSRARVQWPPLEWARMSSGQVKCAKYVSQTSRVWSCQMAGKGGVRGGCMLRCQCKSHAQRRRPLKGWRCRRGANRAWSHRPPPRAADWG